MIRMTMRLALMRRLRRRLERVALISICAYTPSNRRAVTIHAPWAF